MRQAFILTCLDESGSNKCPDLVPNIHMILYIID